MPPPLRSLVSRATWTSSLGGIGDAFGDRNFRLYSIGSIVSWLSFFVQAVAVAWSAWELTHSTRWLAIVAFLDAVPNIALMPLGGVLADRHDRFRILLGSYACATGQAAILAALSYAGSLTIGALAALAFLHGTIHAFSIPAQYGLLPRFIERDRLPSAIAVASAYTNLGIFIGPALAGWVILHFGAATAFASNVVGYAVFFAATALMRTPAGYAKPPRSGKAFVADLQEGAQAIIAHRGIMALLALLMFGEALATSVRQLAPAFADTVLHAGVAGFSTLLACAGVGATFSALWLAQGGAKRATVGLIAWAFLGFLAATTTLMLARTIAAAGLSMVIRGFFLEICRTASLSLLQNAVPDHLRGRVMSTQFLVTRLAGVLGVTAVGATADLWGLQRPVLCCVALAVPIWIVVIRRRKQIAAAFGSPIQPS